MAKRGFRGCRLRRCEVRNYVRIDDVKADLKPGSSAIITYVALDWVYKAIANLQNEGAIVHHETIQEKTLDDAVGALEGAPA